MPRGSGEVRMSSVLFELGMMVVAFAVMTAVCALEAR